MIDPAEQEAFRRSLRLRTRPQPDDDDDWTPHPRWNTPQNPHSDRLRPGPPRQPNPSAAALAARRYREQRRQLGR